MILTTYKVHQNSETDFWYLTEGIAGADKKVVIAHVKDNVIVWDSRFDNYESASDYWYCLGAAFWNPTVATRLYRLHEEKMHALLQE